MTQTTVAVFAKPPIPGQAKTRLGAGVGHGAAARMAVALLRDVWEVARTPRWSQPVVATTDVGDRSFGLGEVVRWDQGGGDLGARVERVLRRGVDRTGRAMALGADTAGLCLEHLQEAQDALMRGRPVMGASDDGGFYLLGLPSCPPGLLVDLPWSRADTFERTRERVEAHLGPVTRLPTLFDVDRVEDLDRLLDEVAAGRIAPGEASGLGAELRRG